MAELYYFWFYALYSFDPVRSERFDREWKTLVLGAVIQELLLATVLYCVGLWTASDFVFRIPRVVTVAGLLVIIAANYLATLRRGVWRRYADAFDGLPRRTRRQRIFVAWGATIIVIALFLGSSYAYRKAPVGSAAWERAIQARERARGAAGETRDSP